MRSNEPIQLSSPLDILLPFNPNIRHSTCQHSPAFAQRHRPDLAQTLEYTVRLDTKGEIVGAAQNNSPVEGRAPTSGQEGGFDPAQEARPGRCDGVAGDAVGVCIDGEGGKGAGEGGGELVGVRMIERGAVARSERVAETENA